MIQTINNRAEFDTATQLPAAIFYIHTSRCAVCHALLPKLNETMTRDYPALPIYTLDADNLQEISASLSVFAAPTILVYFEGKEWIRLARNININAFAAQLQRPYQILFG
ncbi:MAG: thioredoxin family protein [Bacteroidales bacterium]|nr:thioredoxin family protein [Bacteroidales bacterium]